MTLRLQNASLRGLAKGLIEVGEDVVDVLDSDAEADHLGQYARVALFFGGHLPMRCGSRMACERLCIAKVHEARDKVKRIVKFYGGCVSAFDADGHQAASAFVH